MSLHSESSRLLNELSNLNKAGRYAEAETLALKFLQIDLDPKVLHNLAVARLHQGKNQVALENLVQLCQMEPDNVDGWNQRALVLARLSQNEEAHTTYLKALALHPEHAGILCNIGNNLSQTGDFKGALEWFERALTADPKAVAARLGYANALSAIGKEADARLILEALLAENHHTRPILLAYGKVMTALNEPEAVLPLLELLVSRESNDMDGLVALAQAQRKAGRDSRALEVYEQVRQRRPKDVNTLVTIGALKISAGDFKDATLATEAALAIEPDMPEAWAQLVRTRKMGADDSDWLQHALEILQKPWPAERAATLQYAVGKYFDDLKEFDSAFAHFQQANELKKSVNAIYNPDEHNAVVNQIIASHTAAVLNQTRVGASQSKLPLFIVGMPRSGTSLTEQILASHPDVYGAGELRYWRRQTAKFPQATLNAGYTSEMLEEISNGCLENLRSYSATASRVVDKMPGNFLRLGMMHAAFPAAKIIHTMRNPVDTCLSIYFQNFNSGHRYATDLQNLAHYYREYHRLMQHWRNTLPKDCLLEVPYDALVEDQEGWSRKIIAFAGLEWNDRCLNFHETERKVGTASNWQVRQKIYKSSKERWRKYERHVGPLIPLLELN